MNPKPNTPGVEPPGNAQQFRLLVQAVTDYAIYMLDPQGRVSTWNAGAERAKGYSAAEIIGEHFSRFYTQEDRASGLPEKALQEAATHGRFENEGWRVRKDGSTFWASVIVDRIQDEAGNLIGFAKVTRDITERRQAQEALASSQAALAQAQKMEAVGQLTGGVAHDFNNLLTVISSNADLLGEPELEERDRRALLDGILRAADRGARLTQQLLAFARRQPLRPRSRSIGALVRNFESVLRRAAGEAVELTLQLSREPDIAKIDGPQFEAAILNLVVNSRDALPRGGRISITTSVVGVVDPGSLGLPDMTPGDYVLISVADTGEGMSPDVLSKVFEPFYTTKEVGKGSGLGLSQVYGFVTQSGGQVRIESAPGRGTTVFCYLPIDHDAQEKQREKRAADVRRGTVLLVEDDAEVMTSATAMLQSLGYDVLTAVDAVRALAMLQEQRDIDVLFTDVVMPGPMNGVELAGRARALRKDLKILLASGYPRSNFSAEHGLLEEFAFLSKPYRWAELSERLRTLQTRTE